MVYIQEAITKPLVYKVNIVNFEAIYVLRQLCNRSGIGEYYQGIITQDKSYRV